MQQSEPRDNQQVDLALQVGWLAGAIDSEGYLGIVPYKHGKKTEWKPALVVSNTDPLWIETAAAILRTLGVGRLVQTSRRQSPKHQPIKRIRVEGHKRVRRLLHALLPYLVSKREEAEEMVKFIALREAKMARWDRNTRSGETTFGPEEMQIVQRLKDLKTQRHLRDSVPVPLRWVGVKRESDLLGD